MLDSYYEVVTPEGVALQLRVANPIPRAIAWGIDLFIRGLVLIIINVTFAFSGLRKDYYGIILIVMFLVTWCYPIFFEAFYKGQTLGKKIMRLRVISINGAPVGISSIISRNLLRIIDMLPLCYAVGLVSCLFDSGGRRLGDRVAGTLVIHEAVVPAYKPPLIKEIIPPPTPLLMMEQQAIVSFSERARDFSVPRQVEIANLATPLTGVNGTQGVSILYAMANWLIGRSQ